MSCLRPCPRPHPVGSPEGLSGCRAEGRTTCRRFTFSSLLLTQHALVSYLASLSSPPPCHSLVFLSQGVALSSPHQPSQKPRGILDSPLFLAQRAKVDTVRQGIPDPVELLSRAAGLGGGGRGSRAPGMGSEPVAAGQEQGVSQAVSGHRDEHHGGAPLWVGLPWPRRSTAPLVLNPGPVVHPGYHNHHQVNDCHEILK